VIREQKTGDRIDHAREIDLINQCLAWAGFAGRAALRRC
jgi:hypothetical protein